MPIKLNSTGGGSVSIDVPSTASTYTLTAPARSGTIITSADANTVTQAMVQTGFAGNGPAFRVYYTGSNQSVTNGVNAKIILNTKVFDTANCFDASTNYRFTPNVAGYYQFNAMLYASASTALGYNYIQVFKNGNQDSAAIYGPYGGASNIGSLSTLIYMNGSTDYVELWAQISGTGTLIYAPGYALTYLSGFLARSA
jgi:hypothetical protein